MGKLIDVNEDNQFRKIVLFLKNSHVAEKCMPAATKNLVYKTPSDIGCYSTTHWESVLIALAQKGRNGETIE